MISNPIFCAIDRPDLEGAVALAHALHGTVGGIKVGLELFTRHGGGAVTAVAAVGMPVFLDLKLHDIPNTVAEAVRGVGGLGAAFLTVHASGGPAMLRAAAAVADRPRLLAVTVLTSLNDADLERLGVAEHAHAQAVRLARLAADCGADGVVCSPREIEAVRAAIGPGPLIVVPGIRPAGAAPDDQKRTMTTAEAHAAGADILVVGRPITRAADPATAARALHSDLRRAA